MKMLKSKHCRENISSTEKIIYKKSGVSLVEIIVALLILAMAALPAVGTFSTYYATSTKQMEQEMALKIAESVVNLINTLSYDMIIDKTLNKVPLDIQTPDGTVQGTLTFVEPGPQMIGQSADGKTPGHPDNLYLKGFCEDIQINRVKYRIEIDVIKEFRSQSYEVPHDDAMDFYYYNFSSSETFRYSSFDPAFVFNITVGFGKAKPIKLSSFRADMVK